MPMIREVTMYRVECDHEDCAVSPQDETDYYAWADADQALDELNDCWDWYRVGDVHLCGIHAPSCADEGCDVQIFNDEFGVFCEDHERVEATT
jgi:hypothetical protein